MELANMASSNMTSGVVMIDGKEYDGKHNSEALSKLKQAFYSPLSKAAKEDFHQRLWEFTDMFYANELDKDPDFQKLSKEKKDQYLQGAFIESSHCQV